jgi:hypothetical protein
VPYVLTIDVANDGHGPPQIGPATGPPPSRTVIEFDVPVGGTETDAKAIARGIWRAYKDVFAGRVKVVSFQQVGLTADVELGLEQVELGRPQAAIRALPGPDGVHLL